MMRLAINILWPSFLVAICAEGFFFSVFDPGELTSMGGLELPPIAGYTIGFFFFWVFCALASMLTIYLIKAPNESEPPF
ncbi:MAG: hypothetical protein JWR21_3608 [Herminiimonas sp.]|nr:hypothetical protein [Herminiimonas sp.]MDB5855528.1 hypothetical protein [Herminiimonas sp.]